MKRLFIITAFFVLASAAVAADVVGILVEPNPILVGERGTLTLRSASAQPTLAPLPSVPGLIWLTSKPRRRIIRKITEGPKGPIEQETHVTAYDFKVLKPGTFEFPELSVLLGNTELKKKIDPLVAEDSGITPADAYFDIQFGIDPKRKWVYVGEAVPIKIRLFCSDRLNIHDAEMKRYLTPSIQLDGVEYRRFRASRVNARFRISQQRTIRNNQSYRVILYDVVVFPQKAQRLAGRVVYAIPILLAGKSKGNDFSALWSNAPKRQVWHAVAGDIPKLEVRKLPMPPPDSLPTGLIGDVRATLTTDRRRVRVGEDVALKLMIRGSGNLEHVQAPKLKLPGFELYQPQVHSDLAPNQASILWVATVKSPHAQIPKLTFATFSPSSGQWQTHSTPIAIEVRSAESRTYGHAPPLFTQGQIPIRFALVGAHLPLLTFLAIFGPLVLIFVCLLRIGRLSPAERELQQELRRLQRELEKTDDGALPDFVCTRVYAWLRQRFELPPGAGLPEIGEHLCDAELRGMIETAAQANYRPSAATMLDRKRLLAALRGLCCLLIVAGLPLMGGQTAESLYRTGKIEAAAAKLSQRIKSGRGTAADLVNRAHCELVLGHYPKALLNYERARRLLPGNTMLRKQVADLRRQLDLPAEPGWRPLRDIVGPSRWLLLAGLCWSIGCLALARLYWRHGRIIRRVLAGMLLATGLPLAAAIHQLATQWQNDGALVVKNSSYHRLPGVPSTVGAVVHTGDEIRILAKRGDWVQVVGPEGEGWIRKTNVGSFLPQADGSYPVH